MFKNKKVLIIGGTGSIGGALAKRILGQGCQTLRIYSRDEYKQFLMQQEMKASDNIRFLLGDVRDKERLDRAMNGIDIVFNLAAMKHVPACEYDPFEAVKTNVIGTQNVIECSIANKVTKVIYTSSDKAVSPTNTMGATKLLAERLISSADYAKGGEIPIFSAVRFGNVIGSRGSVVPLWRDQIANRKEITVTDPDMTRFMMSIFQAVDLMLKTISIAMGGEIFVLKMPIVRLGDLAEVVIEEECNKLGLRTENVNIVKTGLRAGEKIYEELMTVHESSNAIEFSDMFAILPHHKLGKRDQYGVKRAQCKEYSSHNECKVTKDEILKMLMESGAFSQ